MDKSGFVRDEELEFTHEPEPESEKDCNGKKERAKAVVRLLPQKYLWERKAGGHVTRFERPQPLANFLAERRQGYASK